MRARRNSPPEKPQRRKLQRRSKFACSR
jgi:hypothetical protein